MGDAPELEALRALLANPDTIRERLLSLEFFALCPNGKRIPVESICEEYARDPTGLALKTFEDRLVIVIQAVFPGIDTPYWQQAFYMSTGTSSGMPGTWLPFDGIVLQGSFYRPNNSLSRMPLLLPKVPSTFVMKGKNGKPFVFSFQEPPKPKKGNLKPRKSMNSTVWFSKYPFANLRNGIPGFTRRAPVEHTLEQKKHILLQEIYGSTYLPEGNYLTGEYNFSRFGTLSYALASHKLGSAVFADGYAAPSMFPFVNKDALNTRFREVLSHPTNLQPCFKEMSETYPITKPNEVNQYIERHHAFSYMNAFRQEGIFPPGLSFLNTPIASLGYSMPLQSYEVKLTGIIHRLWIDYKLGLKTLDEIGAILANPRASFKKYEATIRKELVLPNEPEFLFTVPKQRLEGPHGKYYGGTRRRQKKVKRRTTKKA